MRFNLILEQKRGEFKQYLSRQSVLLSNTIATKSLTLPPEALTTDYHATSVASSMQNHARTPRHVTGRSLTLCLGSTR